MNFDFFYIHAQYTKKSFDFRLLFFDNRLKRFVQACYCFYFRIQKTKEMRRPSTTEDLVNQGANDGLVPERRKDLLLNVIRSENFRKLLSTRSE